MQTASLSQTPKGMRLAIGFYGRTNSGKSSLINALTGQSVSLVSEQAGTTTDPVSKAMEFYPLGPCLFIDTAGFGDQTAIGEMRMERTTSMMDQTDLAVLVLASGQQDLSEEKAILEALESRKIPVVVALNQIDKVLFTEENLDTIKVQLGILPIPVSALTKQGLSDLREAMVKNAPADFDEKSLVGHLVKPKDRVLLVMPQDLQAPKGRLILPQVQTIRDLLDHGAVVSCVTVNELSEALSDHTPDLIITDSQVFPLVYAHKPEQSRLTSFSVLLARYKGDIDAYTKGVKAVHKLKPGDRVLIAEACSHQPLDGDIGRVKIPNLIHKKIHEDIQVEVVAGNDFPTDLTPYALVIHCGGCMFGRRQVLSRVMRAVEQDVPITNYGIFFAEMTGILNQVEI